MIELWRRRSVDAAHDGPLALVAAILAGSADLAGAACVDSPCLYDPDVRAESLGYPDEDARWSAVTDTCVGCPARGRCWAWMDRTSVYAAPTGPTAASVINPFRFRHRADRAAS